MTESQNCGRGRPRACFAWGMVAMIALPLAWALADTPSSYSPVVIKEEFKATKARMEAAKPDIMLLGVGPMQMLTPK